MTQCVNSVIGTDLLTAETAGLAIWIAFWFLEKNFFTLGEEVHIAWIP